LTGRAPEVPSGVADIIARCLQKAPGDRFGSASEIVGALDAVSDAHDSVKPDTVWWRAHQIIVSVLYVAAATLAWVIKERVETPVTVAIFLALSAAATIGPVVRGHLVFTEQMNRSHLTLERRRTSRAIRLLDLLTGGLLFADAAIIARVGALWAVCALALALGIVLASIVLEPATTAAAFGDEALEPGT
jgi:hypothetical protein